MIHKDPLRSVCAIVIQCHEQRNDPERLYPMHLPELRGRVHISTWLQYAGMLGRVLCRNTSEMHL